MMMMKMMMMMMMMNKFKKYFNTIKSNSIVNHALLGFYFRESV